MAQRKRMWLSFEVAQTFTTIRSLATDFVLTTMSNFLGVKHRVHSAWFPCREHDPLKLPEHSRRRLSVKIWDWIWALKNPKSFWGIIKITYLFESNLFSTFLSQNQMELAIYRLPQLSSHHIFLDTNKSVLYNPGPHRLRSLSIVVYSEHCIFYKNNSDT